MRRDEVYKYAAIIKKELLYCECNYTSDSLPKVVV